MDLHPGGCGWPRSTCGCSASSAVSTNGRLSFEFFLPPRGPGRCGRGPGSERWPSGIQGFVVPGSEQVPAAAEAEGSIRFPRRTGFEWRETGCSMCLAMNPDRPRKAARFSASSSNRNFKGRQGSAVWPHPVDEPGDRWRPRPFVVHVHDVREPAAGAATPRSQAQPEPALSTSQFVAATCHQLNHFHFSHQLAASSPRVRTPPSPPVDPTLFRGQAAGDQVRMTSDTDRHQFRLVSSKVHSAQRPGGTGLADDVLTGRAPIPWIGLRRRDCPDLVVNRNSAAARSREHGPPIR